MKIYKSRWRYLSHKEHHQYVYIRSMYVGLMRLKNEEKVPVKLKKFPNHPSSKSFSWIYKIIYVHNKSYDTFSQWELMWRICLLTLRSILLIRCFVSESPQDFSRRSKLTFQTFLFNDSLNPEFSNYSKTVYPLLCCLFKVVLTLSL